MKIDRRSFIAAGLSLGAGATAGTLLSPLPWKLMDDSSIWSQNWPWTPVPKDGEVTFENSVCTLCPGNCGITVRKIQNRIVKIEGMKDYPVNDGGVCILGLSNAQLLYGPTRIKSPMKKVGGKLRKISWEEAFSTISEKLSDLRSNGKSDKVACITDANSGAKTELLERFMKAYGSSNFYKKTSFIDSYKEVIKKMHGKNALPGFDVENSNLVLSFGSGIIEGWLSPLRMIKANSGLKNSKGKLIQIESSLSNTASVADEWIPANPGTEAELAFGIANVIIDKNLYDRNFISRNTTGFNSFKSHLLSNYSLNKVSKVTGVKVSQIISLAKKFAGASNPIAVCGRGNGRTATDLNEIIAVHSLNVLVGNINKKGGISSVNESGLISWPSILSDSISRAGNSKKSVGSGMITKLAHEIKADKNRIELLLVADANPRYTESNSRDFNDAIDNISYVVSFSSFMDETAVAADLVLPSHTNLEQYEAVKLSESLSKPGIGLAKPVTEPQFNTKPLGDIVISIAKELGDSVAKSFPWDNYEACLEEVLGDNWDTLKEEQFVLNENSGSTLGSAKFISSIAKVELKGNKRSFPFTLVPYDTMRLSSGYIGDPPFAIKSVPDTELKGLYSVVRVNPSTAKKQGLFEGKKAVLTTPAGEAKVKVHLDEGIMPGVIAMAKGLGHSAYDKYLGGKGSNVFELISSVEDPVSGMDISWGARADLVKG